MTDLPPPVPECWGHRGASAAFPENTIASFDRAVRDGSEGIESDVHVSKDNVIVMFHDPSLERTTDGKGLIREQNYHGNIEHARTKQEPKQAIPTFHQLCDLLMRPENMHVKLNIDIKPDNDPNRLFSLMKEIVSSYPAFERDLSPRLILGLWHPKFLGPALQHVPSLRRVHIGASPSIARRFFWEHCDGFSMYFASLVGAEGQEFIKQAEKDNKDVFVWTVNRKDEMIEAARWGVKAILTDRTATLKDLRSNMQTDFATLRREEVGMFFRWATWRYWTLPQYVLQSLWISQLEKRAGMTFAEGHSTLRQTSGFPSPTPLPAPVVVGEADADEKLKTNDDDALYYDDSAEEPASGPSTVPSSQEPSPQLYPGVDAAPPAHNLPGPAQSIPPAVSVA